MAALHSGSENVQCNRFFFGCFVDEQFVIAGNAEFLCKLFRNLVRRFRIHVRYRLTVVCIHIVCHKTSFFPGYYFLFLTVFHYTWFYIR